MRKAKEKPFAKESDLCAAFIRSVPQDWAIYPETQGWDILLVRKADGFQIGIQAKLRMNAHVLNQAIESRYGATNSGPDCRAVLVPAGDSGGLGAIADYIGITVITLDANVCFERSRNERAVGI